MTGIFLSTLSLRRATRTIFAPVNLHHNFYPRSPCGERHFEQRGLCPDCYISIHALLAESDNSIYEIGDISMLFLSTLSLRRATIEQDANSAIFVEFLSTLSLRRATCCLLWILSRTRNFYPRSPCGERRQHPLHPWLYISAFLSTLSLRRATWTAQRPACRRRISIHALLAESDCAPAGSTSAAPKFLSTLSLRRATSCAAKRAHQDYIFLSTLSLRRAT